MREALALVLASVLGVAPASAVAGSCVIEEVSITWGFKESFRSYISGAIAKGSWQVSGDVGYETPAFEFSGGTGSLAPDRSEGDIAFQGEILFEGHEGILRTSVANPVLQMTGSRTALLVVDVAGDTMDEVTVNQSQVPFATLTWEASAESVDEAAGVFIVEDAEVVLTRAGSEAFGTYPEGELMDPLSWTMSLTPGCLEEQGVSFWWIAANAAGVAVLATTIALVLRRGRKSPEPERP
jgi:hypothetical protein